MTLLFQNLKRETSAKARHSSNSNSNSRQSIDIQNKYDNMILLYFQEIDLI